VTGGRAAWVDASAGIAGDMLLGALLDAGARLDRVQAAVDAVVPGAVEVRTAEVTRAGLRALKAEVVVRTTDRPHRDWTTVRTLLEAAALDAAVHDRAVTVFTRLAEAEARAHGIRPEDVHFHEVGALDAIADVVGTCAALVDLGVTELVGSPIAVGSGTVRTRHGTLPVPGPAVLQLVTGWEVLSGGTGELATPTGVALVTALASGPAALPPMTVAAVGVGAGTRDTPDRANVTRVVVGAERGVPAGDRLPTEEIVLLEANVDDLDPRLWPEVLTRLMADGAHDAWLTPVLMKKGRPAHTVHVLAAPDAARSLSAALFALTSTLGVRRSLLQRDVLDRDWQPVPVAGGAVRVKVGHRAGRIVRAMPEFADVVALAATAGQPAAGMLVLAHAAAVQAGLVAGAPWPAREGLSPP